ncbi:hypothetical protein [Pseudohongiella spirulinae]|uniref:Uncharacterized protein n=1 Tax=Pseudohongiella spirulinae TaxID=1249552 RepID=A0A0S2KGX7_9GAMM|nr:hypothetical protein [Pseudohongiella spirulinae]ALO47569.1 hypothetical protein PS2015_2942 [Pseudohongiella spirulinae]
MSAVLELNDQALSLYQDGQLLASSPGYVLSIGKQPQFGVQAASQSRLHPVSTNNEFWNRLSMSPLSRPVANFRHYADMAHAHLLQLGELADYEGPVVLAVPGNFNREQLAILSGIVRHSPFTVSAMLDSGIAAAAGSNAQADYLVYLDLQLHQAVFTVMRKEGQRLVRQQVLQTQSAGWDAMSNALVQTVNDEFISQCRFNPQHSAQWEQQLFNELPQWLSTLAAGAHEIVVEIETDKSTHKASVSATDLRESISPALDKLSQQLLQFSDVDASDVPLLISSRSASIPGLVQHFGQQKQIVSGEQLAHSCVQLLNDLPGNETAVPYLTSVNLRTREQATKNEPQPAAATHLLVDGSAWPLNNQPVFSQQELTELLQKHRLGELINHQGRQLQLIRVHHGVG